MLFKSCLKKAHSSVPRHHLSLAVLLQRETDFLLVVSVRIGDLILLPRLVTLQPTGEVLEAARAIAPFLIQLHLCFYETFW